MFSNATSGLTASDVLSLTNNENGFGGNGSWIWIILLIILFGGFGNGFGANNGVANNYVLAPDFSNLSRQIDNATDGIRQQNVAIANGISSLGYDQLNQMNGINTNIANANFSTQTAINGIGTQLQNCCCENRQQIADLKYTMATENCATRQAIADSTKAIVDKITTDRMAELESENNALRLSASQTMQNQYLINALRPSPVPAFSVGTPFYYGGYGTTIA